jgi:hypothetical protein
MSITNTFTDSILLGISDMVVKDSVLYGACYSTDSIVSIDITNPNSPSILDTITDVVFNKASSIVISGNYAFVSGKEPDTITSVNITNPSVMLIEDSISLIGSVGGLAISGNSLVIASIDYTTMLVDITDPAALVLKDSVDTGYAVDVTILDSTYAMVVEEINDSIRLVDITDTSNLVASTLTSLLQELNGATYSILVGNVLYVVSYVSAYLSSWDVSSLPNVSFIDSLIPAGASGLTHVKANGTALYVVSRGNDTLKQVKFTADGLLTDVTSIALGTSVTNAICTSGDYIFVGGYTSNSIQTITLT